MVQFSKNLNFLLGEDIKYLKNYFYIQFSAPHFTCLLFY